MTAEHFQACIYEIWDKEQGKVFWVSKSMGEILDEKDDPLQLEGFFPCPKPMYATLTTDSLEPVPDFVLYQDQAKQLDTLADRIDGFINALKVRGVYDASEESINAYQDARDALHRILSEENLVSRPEAEAASVFRERKILKSNSR